MNLPDNIPDQAWLAQVFREHEVPLMAYCTHFLGDPDRAGDVVQDAFVKLCKQPRQQVQDCVRQWLYRVCRNRALDILKKEQRMKSLDDAHAAAQPGRETDPRVTTERTENAREAANLICDLPKNQQEVIRLKVHGGMSYREISDITGLSVSNVGYLLHVGLKSVRTRLATAE